MYTSTNYSAPRAWHPFTSDTEPISHSGSTGLRCESEEEFLMSLEGRSKLICTKTTLDTLIKTSEISLVSFLGRVLVLRDSPVSVLIHSQIGSMTFLDVLQCLPPDNSTRRPWMLSNVLLSNFNSLMFDNFPRSFV